MKRGFEMDGRKLDVQELTQTLNDISRNTGKISFKVTYTATEGNMEIHKAFQEFCFDKANNEYLAGIGKLLECAAFMDYLLDINARLDNLEKMIVQKTTEPVVETKKEEKNLTF